MLALWAGIVLPQFLVAPESVAALTRELDDAGRQSQAAKLSCSITPIPAQLGFSFMHWSGFGMRIPLKQFDGKATDLGVMIQIQPKQAGSAAATYLGERFRVPGAEPGQPPPPKNSEVQYTGGYYLGPGEYRVRMLTRTVDGRLCRKDWNVNVRAGREPLTMEPNQVVAVGSQRWKGLPQTEPRRRATIVIEASPLFPRRNMVRLSSYDRSALLTALTTVLDKSGFTHASVIAADSRNRKVVFSEAEFGPRELRRLGRALGEINLGVVSMKTLQGPGPAEFLESVLDGAQKNLRESDALIFIGPAWSWNGKLTPRLKEMAGGFPAMHHLALTRFPFDDNLLARLVKAGNGSARLVYTPADLAKAIEKIVAKPASSSGE